MFKFLPLRFVRKLLELVLKSNLFKEAAKKRIIHNLAQIRNEDKGKTSLRSIRRMPSGEARKSLGI